MDFTLHYTCRNAPEDTAIRISVKQYVYSYLQDVPNRMTSE